MAEITRLLSAVERRRPQAAEELLPLVYEELRKLAATKIAQEKPGNTLQPTALVHEAYLRLVDVESPQQWTGRGHFFSAAAEAMRRILVESARKKQCAKRGGNRTRLALMPTLPALEDPSLDIVALDEALTVLEEQSPEKAELVKLRFFAGLTIEEAATTLDISCATAKRHWAYARAWLYGKLKDTGSPLQA